MRLSAQSALPGRPLVQVEHDADGLPLLAGPAGSALLQLFGPYAPIGVLVSAADQARAQTVVRSVLS